MRVRSLTLRNYRSLANASFKFGDSVSLLVGPNNCGKTAVLRAIDRLSALPVTFEVGDARQGSNVPTSIELSLAFSGEHGLTEPFGGGLHPEVTDLTILLEMAPNAHAIVKSLSTTDRSGDMKEWITTPQGVAVGSSEHSVNTARHLAAAARQRCFFLVHNRAPKISGPSSGADLLDRDLGNLVQRLVWIRNNEEDRFDWLRDQLALLVPGVGRLIVKIHSTTASLVVMSGGREIPLSDLGAGVAHLLALLVVLSEPLHRDGFLLIDEPETSLHPAGQRLLYAMIAASSRQVIVASHSSIFLQETDPQDVYIFKDGTFRQFTVPDSRALQEFGLRASDLATASALFLVEGKSEIEVFRHLADLLHTPLPHTTKIVSLGTGNSPQAKSALRAIQELFERMPIPALCVLDRDERSAHQLNQLGGHANIHVLARRELENYLVVPRAIARYLKTLGPVVEEGLIDDALNSLPDRVFYLTFWKQLRESIPRLTQPFLLRENDALIDELCKLQPSDEQNMSTRLSAHLPSLPQAILEEVTSSAEGIMKVLREAWQDPQKQLVVFPGEEILQHVFSKFGRRYDKTRDAHRIAECMEAHEIDSELVELLGRAAKLS